MLRKKRDRLQAAFVQITQDEAEVNAFVELATQADQKALKQLIHALKNIKENTKKSYLDDVAHEKNSQTTYHALKALLKSDIKKLTSMLNQETKNFNHYKKKVQHLIIAIDNTRKLRKAKKAERVATINERDAKEQRYNADKAQRNKERSIIIKIQKIVKARIANMSKYLSSQVDK